jgi:lipopolysaccharide/colanic/teichoic acid biosynthesis glycosyltransferase
LFAVWWAMRDRRALGLKRAGDLVAGLVGLVVTLPIQAITAAAVLASLGRPVIFRQRRTGLGGAEFTLYKFRTMRDAPGEDADRLTRVGRLLRRTSLDELPSLLNVVRGDMSLVGPRPLLPEYLRLYSAEQFRRHEVRPGMSGLAQVSGRNLLIWETQFDLDVEYVDTWSLGLDLRILWLTLVKVLGQEGITAPGEATRGRFTGSRQ